MRPSESEKFEISFARLSVLMAQWILDPKNNTLLAEAINKALDNYDSNYERQLDQLRRYPQHSKKSEVKSNENDIEWLGQCVSTIGNIVDFTAEKISDGAVYVYSSQVHVNRAISFRNSYGPITIQETPITVEGADGSTLTIDDLEYMDVNLRIPPEKSEEAFLNGLFGADGWKTEGHAFFGHASMKTLIMHEVFLSFKKTLQSQSAGDIVESLNLLTAPQQAHYLFLQISSAVQGIKGERQKLNGHNQAEDDVNENSQTKVDINEC